MHVIVYVLHNQVIVCNMWHHSEISKTKEQRHCTEILLYARQIVRRCLDTLVQQGV